MIRHKLIGAICLCGLLALSTQAFAVGGVNTPNPGLPPTAGSYMASLAVFHSIYGPAIVQQAAHKGFTNIMISTTPSGDEIENFDSMLDAMVSVGAAPPVPVLMTGPVSTLVLGKAGHVTGTFDTEMLSMSLTGMTPLGPIMIRESPTLPSLGKTSISDIGGGLYHIDSFFDVFTELSIDGGQQWIPSEGPTHVRLCPEPTSIALVSLALVGLVGLARRRR
jgi:hypothetical protein